MAKKNKNLTPIKVIIALCEGKTDLAFLRRLLNENDYKDYKEIIGNIPKPLGLGGDNTGSIFIKKLEDYQYDSSKIMDRPILPIILKKNKKAQSFVLLYDMNGMDRPENYREIINDFKNYTSALSDDYDNGFEKSKITQMDMAIAFIYDLDDKSVKDRVSHIQNKYKDLIPELENLNEQATITNSKDFKGIGYHILTDDSKTQGSLEDIILPMMSKGKEKLIEDAKSFLNSDGGFSRGNAKETKQQSDFKKSLIGTIGQIEYSGLGNEGVIKLTSLINKDKFNNSLQCQEILRFFNQLWRTLR